VVLLGPPAEYQGLTMYIVSPFVFPFAYNLHTTVQIAKSQHQLLDDRTLSRKLRTGGTDQKCGFINQVLIRELTGRKT